MTPYIQLTILMFIIASLHAVKKNKIYELNDPKILEAVRNLLAAAQNNDADKSNESDESSDESEVYEPAVEKHYNKEDAFKHIGNYLQASKQRNNMFSAKPKRSRGLQRIYSINGRRAAAVAAVTPTNQTIVKNDTVKPIKNVTDLNSTVNEAKEKFLQALNQRKNFESEEVSSSREIMPWKEQWKRFWIVKQWQALNATIPTGDAVQMSAARPWGVACGDPGQHDMPWGSCMLSAECEPEYRIYRGDYFCGKSSFICCAIQLTTYDLYQGFDVSFEGKDISTDSEEHRHDPNPVEAKKKKKADARKKRQDERNRRKKAIRSNIRKVLRAISDILNRARSNSTKARKRQTKRMKAYVKALKAQYKQDRLAMKRLHEEKMLLIDAELLIRLHQVERLNHNFMSNATFREMLETKTMTRSGARMLLEAYPDLADVLPKGLSGRRDYMDYDFHNGFAYI